MNPFCCAMRQRFVVAIVGVNPNVAEPTEVVDFVVDFQNESGGTTLGFKYCPWCGKPLNYATDSHYKTSPPSTE